LDIFLLRGRQAKRIK